MMIFKHFRVSKIFLILDKDHLIKDFQMAKKRIKISIKKIMIYK
jgi:hypothetical protein